MIRPNLFQFVFVLVCGSSVGSLVIDLNMSEKKTTLPLAGVDEDYRGNSSRGSFRFSGFFASLSLSSSIYQQFTRVRFL